MSRADSGFGDGFCDAPPAKDPWKPGSRGTENDGTDDADLGPGSNQAAAADEGPSRIGDPTTAGSAFLNTHVSRSPQSLGPPSMLSKAGKHRRQPCDRSQSHAQTRTKANDRYAFYVQCKEIFQPEHRALQSRST
ncbi:MAG: hypothetical protein Q9174_004767, partial [Haloplaca sp. 1 TL-2023]